MGFSCGRKCEETNNRPLSRMSYDVNYFCGRGRSVWVPLRGAVLFIVVAGAAVSWVAIGRRVLIVAVMPPVGQTRHVGVVEVDVGGLGGLAVGVVVAVAVAVVVVMVVGVGHGVGSRQPSHRLLHVSVVRWRLHLQGSLRGVGLLVVGAPVTAVHEVITKESPIAL